MSKRTSRKKSAVRRRSRATSTARKPVETLVDPEELDGTDAREVAVQAHRLAATMELGGTVTVPEHDSVGEWARALGVERSPG